MEFFSRKAKNIGGGKIWAGVFLAKGAGKNMGAAAILAMVLSLLIPEYTMGFGTGKVVDIFTKKPIEGALIISGKDVQRTDANGLFKTNGDPKVAVRAHGYLRTEQMIVPHQEIKLMPFTPRALYLSFYGIGDRSLRESALKLIKETELNALVIDVKGDRGMIAFKSAIPLASEVGAQKIRTVKDVGGLVKYLRENGIYTIARIVTFKDNLLALKRPDLAVKAPSGEVWRDRENLAWVDPFQKEVWDYNISVAIEAAQYGFDEIQFDYLRFPDAVGLHFSQTQYGGKSGKGHLWISHGGQKPALPLQCFSGCGYLRLRELEFQRYRHRAKTGGIESLSGLHLADALPFGIPVRDTGLPESGCKPLSKLSILPLRRPKNVPNFHPFVSGRGCKHLRIMPSTEGTLPRKK